MLTDGVEFDNQKINPPGATGGEPLHGGEVVMDDIATYRRYRISYFPLRKKSKRPLLDEWTVFQTRPPLQEEDKVWETRKLLDQVAIVTGQVSGYIVLDEDNPPIFQAWLKENNYHLPPTATVKTSSFKDDQGNTHQKFHYYFKHPGGRVKNMIKQIPGADIKGDGGYCVAPPSIHPGGEQYEWCFGLTLDDYPDTPVPSWLLEHLNRDVDGKVELAQGDLLPLDEDWVEIALRGVTKDHRNSTATRLAGYYLGRGEPESRVLAMMRNWNLNNTPPLSEKELQRTVTSIARTEARKRIKEGAGHGGTQTEVATDLPWEEQRQAALQGLGELLGMPIEDVLVSAGYEGTWEIILDNGISIMLTSSEVRKQQRFHDRVWAAAIIQPNTVPKARNGVGGWEGVLKTLATWATRVDAGPEATLKGEVQELINNWLSGYKMCYFERGKSITPHVPFFILKQEGKTELYMRLDQLCIEANQSGHKITRKNLVGILSSLGHVNQRLKWPGCDSMVWRLNMDTIPHEIKAKIYKEAIKDGND